ncbi:hypothetical protein ZIOFF_036656 [Zingiber officinale]|uniref:FAE domain-containing protein n=1 Tax=Zingiber officinale TaxID=94328 RepID=A0A8J5L896_ZINOF|nr:hypothetical protein ZIOFF_036656 [Zingiber officinale]
MSNASNDPIALVAFDSIWSQSAVVLIWTNVVTSPVSTVDHFMLVMSSPTRPPRARHEQRAAARLSQVAGAPHRAVASKQQVTVCCRLMFASSSECRSRNSKVVRPKTVNFGARPAIELGHGWKGFAKTTTVLSSLLFHVQNPLLFVPPITSRQLRSRRSEAPMPHCSERVPPASPTSNNPRVKLKYLSTFSLVDLRDLWNYLRFNLVSVVLYSTLLVFFSTVYFLTRPRPVYLLDFAYHEPDESRKCSRKLFLERSKLSGSFTEENLEFQHKILERSGLGENTYLPDAVLNVPPNPCMDEARKEAKDVMFGAIDELIAKTNIKPKDIGILVVNCSLFNPTPSLFAMVVNHYKLKGNIVSYNLGGMGCSAGLISIDLAKNLLQVHPNSYALVISMENITLNWYFDNDSSMLNLMGSNP